jgi:hypothetical protein
MKAFQSTSQNPLQRKYGVNDERDFSCVAKRYDSRLMAVEISRDDLLENPRELIGSEALIVQFHFRRCYTHFGHGISGPVRYAKYVTNSCNSNRKREIWH